MADCKKCAHFLTCKHYTTNFNSCAQFMSYENTVEVVRCKDCKKGHSELAPNGGVWCAVWNHVFRDDEFCSKGERKDNEID